MEEAGVHCGQVLDIVMIFHLLVFSASGLDPRLQPPLSPCRGLEARHLFHTHATFCLLCLDRHLAAGVQGRPRPVVLQECPCSPLVS